MTTVTSGELLRRVDGLDGAYLHRWRVRGLIRTVGDKAPRQGGHHAGRDATRWPRWVGRLVPLLFDEGHEPPGYHHTAVRRLWAAVSVVLQAHPHTPCVVVPLDAEPHPATSVEEAAAEHVAACATRPPGVIVVTTIVVLDP